MAPGLTALVAGLGRWQVLFGRGLGLQELRAGAYWTLLDRPTAGSARDLPDCGPYAGRSTCSTRSRHPEPLPGGA